MSVISGGLLEHGQDVGLVRLRGHQQEAVEAIVRALTPGPGEAVPEGLRATVQMATGTGKSFVGAVAGQHLAPHGTVLVVVPTLDLLVQMVDSWRAAGRKGDMAAVCSLEPGELPHGVPGSTHPLVVGRWLAKRPRPLTLFTTYASAGALADAYAAWAELTDETLPAFDLMVCDEAHRSSGSAEKSWTVVHHQDQIPADRRLYMTATPRIWLPPKARTRRVRAEETADTSAGLDDGAAQDGSEGGVAGAGATVESGTAAAGNAVMDDAAVVGREGAFQPLPRELAVSMDDVRLYGPQVFTLGLAEAVARGLVAPFEIVVLELRDPLADRAAAERQPVPWGAGAGEAKDGSEDRVPVEHLAAVQAGLLKVCAEEQLEKVITFHHRTLEARYFSETLNQTAEKLHTEDPAVYPAEVWAQWLSGEHPMEFRKAVLDEFGAGAELDGIGVRIVSNCLVLGEGVDTPDAVAAVLNGSGSMVKTVQQIGRVLRMKPGEGKLARLIVPVFLGPGEEPGDILTSDSYGPLVQVLTAIASHDSRMLEALAVPQRSGRRTVGHGAESIVLAGQIDDGEDAGAFVLPVRFQGKVTDSALALFVSTQVLRSESVYWRDGMRHCQEWYEKHGDLNVPYAAVAGADGEFPLGRWVADRRHERAAGDMDDWRIRILDKVGMIWSIPSARFEAGLDEARQWAASHAGSLAAPARAWINGYPIGAWLAAQRAAAAVPEGQSGALSAARRAALDAIDPWWCPSWPITWQRTYATARAWWLAADGHVDWPALPEPTVFDGEPLGRWVKAQRAGWTELDREQQELLLALGIEQDQTLAKAKAVREKRTAGRPRVSQADRFALGFAALKQFAAREGHTRVPRTHKEELVTTAGAASAEGTSTVVGLGAWLNNTKSRRAGLSAEQRAALAAVGVEWA